MKISVCMATYNGEKYVERQLRSILDQLASQDEVIVVDDCSTDATVSTIRRIRDSRIQTHVNDRNRREVYSFARAIEMARGDYIFMADQDDVWRPGRVQAMLEPLMAGTKVVSSNFHWITADEVQTYIYFDGVRSQDSARHVRNIIEIFVGKTNYFGCAMAFRKELIPVITPIPEYVESHDLWVAMAGNLAKSNAHLDLATLLKRKHDNNTTSPVSNRSLYRKLRARLVFALSAAELWRRGVTH